MKFSIRDLMLVTVIAALTVGWWVDRTRLLNEEAEIRAEKQYIEAKFIFNQAAANSNQASEKAIAVYMAATAKAKEALAARHASVEQTYEHSVRGYNLLGPDLPEPPVPAER